MSLEEKQKKVYRQSKGFNSEEYMLSLLQKIEPNIHFSQKIKIPKNKKKDDLSIPTIKTYSTLYDNNYSLPQLKDFLKYYKLKISGNKQILLLRIYSYLHFSSYATKIQTIFRGYSIRNYILLHGPAIVQRNLCVNNSDFVTLEPLEDINIHQFISYKDDKGIIYGFDIVSLYNLIFKGSKEIINPYNRSSFPSELLVNIKYILRFSKRLGINIDLNIETENSEMIQTNIQQRTNTLFQNIDQLGNYTNSQWFLSLDKIKLIRFVHELKDIWNYRAQLSNEVKRNICPPDGNPFRNMSMHYIQYEPDIQNIQKTILSVLEQFVNSSNNDSDRSLGCYYVLAALTIVNTDAAYSLPWLFEAVQYFYNN
jgi:hypothetical protein